MKPMGRTLKAIAILALAVAMLNASPGLCFCRHAAAESTSGDSGEHSCCHRTTPTIGGTGSACCQIDRAERNATAQDFEFAADAAPLTVVPIADPLFTAARRVQVPVVPSDSSPPVQHLRL